MAEWLTERGIGESRAALVEGGTIIEARIEVDGGLRAGSVIDGRLTEILVPGKRGVVVANGIEAMVEPLPRALTQGASVRVEIVREAIPEPGKAKRAKAKVAADETALSNGPGLFARIGSARALSLHEADALEAVGWSECLESAACGEIAFPGGALRISLTPAMTLIDVDGMLGPAALAIAGAQAAGAAIRRFDISGSIGIDLPTVGGKADRIAAAEALDAALPQPFERTAVNGFGFMQIVRPRIRASLCELLQHDRAGAEARALMRRAQRSGIIGASALVVPPSVAHAIQDDWIAELAQHFGGPVALRTGPALAMSGGYVVKAS